MLRVATTISLAAVILLASVDADAGRRRGRKGALELECSVDGAQVWVDGKVVGITPIKQQALSAGAHTLKVTKLGYIEHSQKIKIRGGKTVQVSADLFPKAGVIKVTANVSGARVLVDGKDLGKVPLEKEVKPGRRTVTVRAKGRSDIRQTINATPGNTAEIVAEFPDGEDSLGDDLALAPLNDDGLALTPLAPIASASTGGKKGGGEIRDGSDGSGGSDGSDRPDAGVGGVGGVDGLGDDDLLLSPLPNDADPQEGDGLELTALTPLLPLSHGGTGAVDANLGGAIGTTVEPATPWYREWWAISGAAAIVVTGVVIGTVVAVNQEGGKSPIADLRWRPGDRVEENVPY